MKTKIVYEDPHLLVVYKPAGIAVQTAKSFEADVVSELKNYLKGQAVYVVHRLDQPVEGLLVFAKTKAAAGKLSAALQKKGEDEAGLNKSYLAVVYGKLPGEIGEKQTLHSFIKKSKENVALVSDTPGPEYKESRLTYEKLAGYPRDNETGEEEEWIHLVLVELMTGRFHQIRAQFSFAGFPLLGDKKYGTPDSIRYSADHRVRTVALCANRIAFKHPVTGKEFVYDQEPQGDIFQTFGQ